MAKLCKKLANIGSNWSERVFLFHQFFSKFSSVVFMVIVVRGFHGSSKILEVVVLIKGAVFNLEKKIKKFIGTPPLSGLQPFLGHVRLVPWKCPISPADILSNLCGIPRINVGTPWMAQDSPPSHPGTLPRHTDHQIPFCVLRLCYFFLLQPLLSTMISISVIRIMITIIMTIILTIIIIIIITLPTLTITYVKSWFWNMSKNYVTSEMGMGI